jgi:hypothetical protein
VNCWLPKKLFILNEYKWLILNLVNYEINEGLITVTPLSHH